MNQKTALTELIEYMENECLQNTEIFEKATELLERERSIVIEAFNEGFREGEMLEDSIKGSGDISEFTDAQIYYRETFTNQ